MPAEDSSPLTIGRAPRREQPGEFVVPGDAAEPLGRAVAAILRHHIAVLDREDRLESGTGDWLGDFQADAAARADSVRDGVLRSLRMATDSVNFRILEELAASDAVSRAALADLLGLAELAVSERVSDLVSAGLAVKVAEANQITGTAAGVALSEWVRAAVVAGSEMLRDELS